MDQNLSGYFKLINILFLFIWGIYERYSAIKKGKIHAVSADRDNGSLLLLYGTIFLGYCVGIPLAFTDYGKFTAGYPYVSVSGFFIIAGGLTIRLIAIKTLNTQFTYTVKIIEDHQLITSGIYQFIRHPSYLGQSLIFLGSGLVLSNWLSLIFLFIPVFLASFFRIAVEEKVLTDYFGGRYIDYKKRTKSLIPWVF